MMTKTVDTSFGAGPRGTNLGFRGYFEVQVTFLTVSTHQPHQTCRKGVFGCLRTSHQIPSQNINKKILFGKKSKYPLGG